MSIAELVPLGVANGRSRWTIEHDGRRFVVLVHEDEYVVIDALCPHRQGPMLQGMVRNGAIVCPSHWYSFDLQTGACRTTDHYKLGRYPVVVRDGVAYAEIPPVHKRSWSDILRAHATHNR
jgi:nitrite reductase/ring-hydroxylating ferredoxin subunit